MVIQVETRAYQWYIRSRFAPVEDVAKECYCVILSLALLEVCCCVGKLGKSMVYSKPTGNKVFVS